MTSVATFNPSLGANLAGNAVVATAQPAQPTDSAAEIAKLKDQLKQAKTDATRSQADAERLSAMLEKTDKELSKFKRVFEMMKNAGKLDVKKWTAAEKFVNEFFE
jgi:molecular chaperone GrpE (heat shock protein)